MLQSLSKQALANQMVLAFKRMCGHEKPILEVKNLTVPFPMHSPNVFNGNAAM